MLARVLVVAWLVGAASGAAGRPRRPQPMGAAPRLDALRHPFFRFLHIPKTGGTSVMVSLEAAGLDSDARMRVCLGGRSASACLASPAGPTAVSPCVRHHLPPDVHERCWPSNSSAAYPPGVDVACVVRDPADRFVSEFAWRARDCPGTWFCDYFHDINAFALYALQIMAGASRDDLGTPRLPITDLTTHLIPQAWFVFDAAGRRRCHTVLLYDDLGAEWSAFTAARGHRLVLPWTNNSTRAAAAAALSPALRERLLTELYAADVALLARARRARTRRRPA